MFNKEKLQEIQNNYQQYHEKTEKSLEKRPERNNTFFTGSGDEINRLYTPGDVNSVDYQYRTEINRARHY